jgi:hypothetical protein
MTSLNEDEETASLKKMGLKKTAAATQPGQLAH